MLQTPVTGDAARSLRRKHLSTGAGLGFRLDAMIQFNSLLVATVAVLVPLLLGLVPAVKVPPVVFEIIGESWSDPPCSAGSIST